MQRGAAATTDLDGGRASAGHALLAAHGELERGSEGVGWCAASRGCGVGFIAREPAYRGRGARPCPWRTGDLSARIRGSGARGVALRGRAGSGHILEGAGRAVRVGEQRAGPIWPVAVRSTTAEIQGTGGGIGSREVLERLRRLQRDGAWTATGKGGLGGLGAATTAMATRRR